MIHDERYWRERAAGIIDRGGVLNLHCQLCGQPFRYYSGYRTEMRPIETHHIISRGRLMMSDPEVYDLIHDKHLLAFLCRSCHEKAHAPEVATALLKSNIALYGYDPVYRAYKTVLDAMHVNQIGIDFPPKEDEGGQER